MLVVAVERVSLRCLRLPERRPVILRPMRGDEAEGEVLEVLPRRKWRFGRTDYLVGDIVGSRIDAAALSPVPLELYDRGPWDPQADFVWLWKENDDAEEELPEWVWAVLRAGPRREFEMQQVIPGADPDEPDDPITQAAELARAGGLDAAFRMLQRCIEADQRCIDAYAHLGCYYFGDGCSEWWVRKALKCYRAGVAIGERALPSGFDGLLPWGWVDNRPFLRALHGLGLCQWRLGDFAAARETFWRLLMLDPWDSLGVRFVIDEVEAGRDYLAWQSETENMPL
ncbi:MAG TPA: hypothetical protein DCL13_04855 [Peptococcaceae bacterium]|nr:hypothetical protein [Peptococcaceae bacterium]